MYAVGSGWCRANELLKLILPHRKIESQSEKSNMNISEVSRTHKYGMNIEKVSFHKLLVTNDA